MMKSGDEGGHGGWICERMCEKRHTTKQNSKNCSCNRLNQSLESITGKTGVARKQARRRQQAFSKRYRRSMMSHEEKEVERERKRVAARSKRAKLKSERAKLEALKNDPCRQYYLSRMEMWRAKGEGRWDPKWRHILGPKGSGPKGWDPKIETYDAFCTRLINQLTRSLGDRSIARDTLGWNPDECFSEFYVRLMNSLTSSDCYITNMPLYPNMPFRKANPIRYTSAHPILEWTHNSRFRVMPSYTGYGVRVFRG